MGEEGRNVCDSGHIATVPAVARVRLDALLARRGVFATRSRAAASVIAGEVRLGTDRRRAEGSPDARAADDVDVSVDEAPEFVSRGGRAS